MSLPDPRGRPLLTVDDVAPVLGLSRSAAYEAARRGELPTIRYGRRLFVVNARLHEQLGLPLDMSEAGPASPATATNTEVSGGPRRDQHPTIRAV